MFEFNNKLYQLLFFFFLIEYKYLYQNLTILFQQQIVNYLVQ